MSCGLLFCSSSLPFSSSRCNIPLDVLIIEFFNNIFAVSKKKKSNAPGFIPSCHLEHGGGPMGLNQELKALDCGLNVFSMAFLNQLQEAVEKESSSSRQKNISITVNLTNPTITTLLIQIPDPFSSFCKFILSQNQFLISKNYHTHPPRNNHSRQKTGKKLDQTQRNQDKNDNL